MNDLVRELFEAGCRRLEQGRPIIPANNKVPCDAQGEPCHDWQNLPCTADRLLAGLSGAREPGIGLRLGPGSGIDAETDSRAEEEALAHLFRGVEAPVTPTFTSRRGRHRLYRWDDRLAAIGQATVTYKAPGRRSVTARLGAGGMGAQSILPSSPGRIWIPGLALDDECPLAELPDVVIDRLLNSAACTQLSNSSTSLPSNSTECNSSDRRPLHEWYKRSDTVDTVDTVNTDGYAPTVSTVSVADAIRWTLPDGTGHRERQLFNFARFVRGMPAYTDVDVESLKPLVREWHAQALPFIGTKSFDASWVAFKRAWKRVKHPAGSGPLDLVFDAAMKRELPAVASRYEDPELHLLIAACRELQEKAGDSPFYISCRAAAERLGTSRTRAWEWLGLLVDDKVLKVVTPGKRNQSTEYRYLGDSPPTTAA